jgi:hypothetical protein
MRVRVTHDAAVGHHVHVLVLVVVSSSAVMHVAVMVKMVVFAAVTVPAVVRVAVLVHGTVRMDVLVFVAFAFDLGFAAAAATGRAHDVLPVSPQAAQGRSQAV